MYYIEEINNSKLAVFFDFILSKCEKVSFKRSYQRGIIENLNPKKNIDKFYEIGFIEKSEFDKIQETMKKAIEDFCIERGYASKEEFKSAYEEELETFSCYINYDKKIKNNKDLSFKGKSVEYLGK